MRWRSLAALLVAMSVGLPGRSLAQVYVPSATAARQAKDLEFPKKPSRLSAFSNPDMAIYKPDGPGPFPGLVLFHQCGGLGEGRGSNVSMLEWARLAVARGYAVLLIDNLTQRGVKTNCFGAQRGVNFMRGVKDAFQAADHLRTFDFVDPERVGLAGYSWGAMVAVLASSRQVAATFGTGTRFVAAVSFYPGCFTIRPPTTRPYEIANPDIDRPLLVLMGGQDNETPPVDCTSRLEPARAAGAPVELHLYPDATHCWDCRHLDGFSKIDVRGTSVTYRYDKATTDDSARRMFEFFANALKREGRPPPATTSPSRRSDADTAR